MSCPLPVVRKTVDADLHIGDVVGSIFDEGLFLSLAKIAPIVPMRFSDEYIDILTETSKKPLPLTSENAIHLVKRLCYILELKPGSETYSIVGRTEHEELTESLIEAGFSIKASGPNGEALHELNPHHDLLIQYGYDPFTPNSDGVNTFLTSAEWYNVDIPTLKKNAAQSYYRYYITPSQARDSVEVLNNLE
jgi:hypothetical protein